MTVMRQTHILGWARLWPTLDPAHIRVLRRGAWYPVVAVEEARFIVDVHPMRVAVPKAWVEMRKRRPKHFTIVNLPPNERNPVRGSPRDLGRMYAVCPQCSTRIRILRDDEETICPRCRHEGDLGWWETG
jgi:hypothetical protein